jgi:four helix bundle protein
MLEDKQKNKFDLEERTAKFGEEVILFLKTVPKNEITRPLISQFIRSATSIGANYMEADGAESRKDFIHKMGICKKECKETKHWLRMVSISEPITQERCRQLWREAQELTLIFSAIIKKTKYKK